MAKEKITLSSYWGDLVDRLPIAAVTGVTYYPASHGSGSQNLPLADYQGMLLEHDLRANEWPVYRRYHAQIGGYCEERTGQQFALGSLVYALSGDHRPYGIALAKAWVRYLCYEREESLRDLVERKVVAPLAWMMVDFDCLTGEENLGRILPVLEKAYPLAPWVLVDSGGSYYFLIEELISPKCVPWHYGKLVQSFASTGLPSRRHIFEGIGKQLQDDWNNPSRLSILCNDILSAICHYDEPLSTKMPFMVDLRYMAHSILELLRYLKRKEGSFGYLRFSKKTPYEAAPMMKAIHGPENGTEVKFEGTIFKSSQLKMSGL